MRNAVRLGGVFALVLLLATQATAVVWDNGGADQNWSTGANWNPDGVPVATDTADFDNGGASGTAGTTTNVMDGAFAGTVAGATFSNTTGNFHTTDLSGGTLTVNGNFVVGENLASTTAVGLTNGSLAVTGTNFLVGRDPSNVSGLHKGTLDLTGLTSFSATVTNFYLGTSTSTQPGNAEGDVSLSDTSTITATTILMGDSPGAGNTAYTSTLALGAGSSTFNVDTLYVARRKSKGEITIGAGGTLTLGGNSGSETDLRIGYNDASGTGTHSVGTMNLSGGTFNATLDQVILGYHLGGGGGSGSGTLTMDAGTVTANSILLGEPGSSSNPNSSAGTINQNGGTITVAGSVTDGGGTSTLNIQGGTFYATNAISVDTINLGATATLGRGARGLGNGPALATTATLANGALLNINDTDGIISGFSVASADQTDWVGGTGTWDNASDAEWNMGAPDGFTINNGQEVTFLQATTLTDNGVALDSATAANWSLTTSSPTELKVTRTGAAITSGPVWAMIDSSSDIVTRMADLHIAEQAGVDATRVDVTNGSLTVGASGDNKNVTLGGASAQGILRQTAGTVEIFGNVLDGGGGNARLLPDGGAMTVHGDVDVNEVRVGYNGYTGSLTVDSGTFAVNHSTLDVTIGRRNSSGGTSIGTLDLSATTSVTIDVDDVLIGIGSSSRGQGTLILGAANTINVDDITVGHSPSTGQSSTGQDSRVELNGTTSIAADTIYIARQKSRAVMEFGSGGGTLNLGSAGDRINNLRIGYNDNSGTGTHSNGLLDGTGGTINAFVDNLVLGQHTGGSGDGTGTLTLENGTFDVNNITMGDPVSSSNPLNTQGIINLNGGTLRAGTIAESGGTATFIFTNGTLSVDNFNLAGGLVQGGGVLSPGNSPGTTNIAGDYVMTGGSILIEIEGVGAPGTAYDVVNIGGDFDAGGGTLDLLVSGLTGADIGTTFDIINLTDDLAVLVDPFSNVPLGGRLTAAGGYIFDVNYNVGTGGNDISLALLSVPEPSTVAMLLGLAGVGLLGYLRRRRRS